MDYLVYAFCLFSVEVVISLFFECTVREVGSHILVIEY